MLKVKSGQEIVQGLRALDDKLKKLKLSSVEIDKNGGGITYNFICDKAVEDELKYKILQTIEKDTSPYFSKVSVNVRKIVSDCEIINDEILGFLRKNFPSLSIFLKDTDVSSTAADEEKNLIKYTVRLTADGIDYAVKNALFQKISDYLSTKFCSEFVGGYVEKDAEESVNLLSDTVFESEIEKAQRRTITVENVSVIDDGFLSNVAVYIEDVTEGGITVCGKITRLTEKTTGKGKPYFIIGLDDGTGKITGVYFSKKSTLDKIRALKEGDAIIAGGNMGTYKERDSFTIDRINRCSLPLNFVKEEKYKKHAPAEYKLVRPTPATVIKVESVFDVEKPLPEIVVNTDFVVFDLETTGLELASNGITEIGAVKIHGGKITEQFTTLVNPDYPITPKNTELTGITPEMVKDSPKISAVIPDFMKFINGAVLVAHNAEFDMRFIKRFAGAEDYEVKNRCLDTMEISREVLPSLKNNKLDTLAEYFGIVFNHHRALDDARTTAEIFLELMRLKEEMGKKAF